MCNEVIGSRPDISKIRNRRRKIIRIDCVIDYISGGRVKSANLVADKTVGVDGSPGDAVVVLPDYETDGVTVVH
jgi:hypothetical protein